jgi:peptide/nickel transport system ATP-binding protein
VFLGPNESLNARFTAFDCIAHPLLRLAGMRPGGALRLRVEECAERVGLPLQLSPRFPLQLSCGQNACVGITRAIACRPLDELTAALDVSVPAVVLQLLGRLRCEDDLSLLFVSHDLNVVRMMCDRSIVLRNGRIVEQGESRALFENSRTDYTRELVDAVFHIGPANGKAIEVFSS